MAGIVHGGLLRNGTLPKSAGDAAFQAFLADLLSKENGGTVNGQVLFQTPEAVAAGNNAGVAILPTGVLSVAVPGKQFLVQDGGFTSAGAGVQNLIALGAGLTISSGGGFNVAAGAFARFDDVVELTATPALPAHLVNKQYVDLAIANSTNGRNWVAAARAVATGNVALIGDPPAVDGVTLAPGDRVLLVGQTAAKENGVYVYDGADLARADDANSAAELVNLTIWVSEGAAHADVQYTCTANKSLVLGTDPVNFVQTGGAGMMLAGWGVGITGNTVAVKHAAPVAPSAGAIDGTNNVFTFAGVQFAADGECVEVDGVRVYKTADYTVSVSGLDTVVSFISSPPAGSRVMLGGFLA